MNVTKDNRIEVTGIVESINLIKGSTDKAGPFIRGDLVITAKVGKTMNIPIPFFAAHKTKAGKVRKLYTQLENLQQGMRINVVGSIEDNKFWDQTRGQLVKTKRLRLNFINDARNEDPDKAEFIYSGFVTSPLQEKFNKNGDSIGFEIGIAQATYNNDRAMNVFFQVDGSNTKAINYITSEYTPATTIKVTGSLDYDIDTVTVEEQVDFGNPIIRTYQNRTSNLMIESGKVLTEEIYERDVIDQLLAADKEDDQEVQAKAKNTEVSGNSVSNASPQTAKTKVNQSLI